MFFSERPARARMACDRFSISKGVDLSEYKYLSGSKNTSFCWTIGVNFLTKSEDAILAGCTTSTASASGTTAALRICSRLAVFAGDVGVDAQPAANIDNAHATQHHCKTVAVVCVMGKLRNGFFIGLRGAGCSWPFWNTHLTISSMPWILRRGRPRRFSTRFILAWLISMPGGMAEAS